MGVEKLDSNSAEAALLAAVAVACTKGESLHTSDVGFLRCHSASVAASPFSGVHLQTITSYSLRLSLDQR